MSGGVSPLRFRLIKDESTLTGVSLPRFDLRILPDSLFYYRTAMASISSTAPLGRADTCTVDRAGGA